MQEQSVEEPRLGIKLTKDAETFHYAAAYYSEKYALPYEVMLSLFYDYKFSDTIKSLYASGVSNITEVALEEVEKLFISDAKSTFNDKRIFINEVYFENSRHFFSIRKLLDCIRCAATCAVDVLGISPEDFYIHSVYRMDWGTDGFTLADRCDNLLFSRDYLPLADIFGVNIDSIKPKMHLRYQVNINTCKVGKLARRFSNTSRSANSSYYDKVREIFRVVFQELKKVSLILEVENSELDPLKKLEIPEIFNDSCICEDDILTYDGSLRNLDKLSDHELEMFVFADYLLDKTNLYHPKYDASQIRARDMMTKMRWKYNKKFDKVWDFSPILAE